MKTTILKKSLIFILSAYTCTSFATTTDCGAVNGIAIPCWRTYILGKGGDESLPYYPYGRRPNGCSIIIKKPGQVDEFKIKNDVYSFKKACDAHDRCFYTPNSEARVCNHILLEKMNKACAESGSDETRFWCYERAGVFYNTVEVAAPIAHTYSQTIENLYLEKVRKYLANRER